MPLTWPDFKYLMTPTKTFLKVTGVCGIVAAAATLTLWLLPYIYGRPTSLPERLDLYGNVLYMTRHWLSFGNVFLVLAASMGLAAARLDRSPGAAMMGMLFFTFYGVAELLGRSTMIFVREYRWAARLVTETDPATRDSLIQAIRRFDEVWGGFYVLLLLCFIFGSFLFGLATRGGSRLQRAVSLFLFLASALAFITLAARYVPFTPLRTIARWGYPMVQPASRFLIGLWLITASRSFPARRSTHV